MSENSTGARLVVILVCLEPVSLLTILPHRPLLAVQGKSLEINKECSRPVSLAKLLQPQRTGIQKRHGFKQPWAVVSFLL